MGFCLQSNRPQLKQESKRSDLSKVNLATIPPILFLTAANTLYTKLTVF